MAGGGPTPKPTLNGLFAYPDENADPWWGLVDGSEGQWATMERLFIANHENAACILKPEGTFQITSSEEGYMLSWSDAVNLLIGNGVYTHSDAGSIPIGVDEWIWFEIGLRPVSGAFAGDYIRVGAMPANPEHCCVLGKNMKGQFVWRGSTDLGLV